MRQFLDRSREEWAFIRRTDHDNSCLAIFVHGFRGNYLTTWGNLPTALEKWADEHQTLQNWDYLFIGYETASIRNLIAIAQLISTQWKLASSGAPPFDHQYNHLSLFGHSLGTLGIRQLLCASSEQPDQFADSLHSVAFFGSPLNGSPLAPFSRLTALLDVASGKGSGLLGLLPGGFAIKDSLQPDGAPLKMLRCWNETIRKHVNLPDISVYQGTNDWVVGPLGKEEKWKGDEIVATAMDHTSISKIHEPEQWQNSNLRDALLRALS
jgi:hypothetical protein